MTADEQQTSAGVASEEQLFKKSLAILDFKQYRWYEVLVLLPMIVIALQGGLIGTVLGVASLELALRWLRGPRSLWLGILGALGITLVYLAAYALIAYVLISWAITLL